MSGVKRLSKSCGKNLLTPRWTKKGKGGEVYNTGLPWVSSDETCLVCNRFWLIEIRRSPVSTFISLSFVSYAETHTCSHDAKKYNDNVNKDVCVIPHSFHCRLTWIFSLEAMNHPRCVALGEIGLDYHYNHSPQNVQQSVFTRQLRIAVRLGKPLVIHTREADDDIERIMKAEVPRHFRVRIVEEAYSLLTQWPTKKNKFTFIVSPILQN